MNKHTIYRQSKKVAALAIFILFAHNNIMAQDHNNIKTPDKVVEIIDVYKPVISDAFKINENPTISDSAVDKLDLKYEITPTLYSTSFSVEPIKPAKIVGDPLKKLYKSYIKAGFGSRVSPYGEVYIGNGRSSKESYGVYYRHLSSAGKMKSYAFPGYSDNEANIFARRFYKTSMLSGNIDYTRNVVHYYGFNPDVYPDISKDSIRQRFSKIGAQIQYKSTFHDTMKLKYAFNLRYENLSELYDAMENHVRFNGSISDYMTILGDYFNDQKWGILADVDLYNDRNKLDTSTASVVRLLPHISSSFDVFTVDAGLNTSIASTTISKFYIFPEINFDVRLYKSFCILYGKLSQEVKRGNLLDLSSENPFMNTSLIYDFSNTKIYLAGFRGTLNENLSYSASISQSIVKNMPLFVNDTTSELNNRFSVIYDDVNVFNTHIEVAYQKAEKFKAMLAANYNNYKTTNEAQAWHKPKMDLRFLFNYNLKDKIILKTEVYAISDAYAKIYADSTHAVMAYQLKGVVDFNLGLEYRYSKILSGFINFNNIGAVKYNRWYHYPTYGFNVMGGVTYAF